MGCVYAKEAESLEETNSRIFRVWNVDDAGHELNPGKLEIGEKDLILYQKGKRVVHWPLRCLRRYGFDAEIFSFESGRRCLTGPGIFAFKCRRSEVLFNLLQESIQRCGAEENHGGGVAIGTSGTGFMNPPVAVAVQHAIQTTSSFAPSVGQRGGSFYGAQHSIGNRGSAPGNMVPSSMAMSSTAGLQGPVMTHSYVNGGLTAAETALTSFTSGPPSTPASPGFDGGFQHSYVNTQMEGCQTPPIEYVTLDLPPSNEDLDEIGVSVLPSSVTRSYNSVPLRDPDTPSRAHPMTRNAHSANTTHSTSQYQRKQQQQQQQEQQQRQQQVMHGRGGIDVEYSTPSSQQPQQHQQQQHQHPRLFDSASVTRAEQSQQQQQHHMSSQRLNEVSASSPLETGSGTVLLSSSSPNSVVSYANMPATNNNIATTDQDSDTTQTSLKFSSNLSGGSERQNSLRRLSRRGGTNPKPKPAPLNIPDSATGSSSTPEISGSSTNPSPSPFRPVIPPRPNPMDTEWRYIYENVDRANGAPPQTPGGANWRFEEPLSPELNYDQVPLPSNKYPSQQSQQQQQHQQQSQHQQQFAHARPAENPSIPPRPPMTAKNLSGMPSAPTIEYATLELDRASGQAASHGVIPKSPSTPLPLSSTPSSISSSSQLLPYQNPAHRLQGQTNGHAGVIGSRPSADMYSQIDIQRTEALRRAQASRGAQRTRLNSSYGDASNKENILNNT